MRGCAESSGCVSTNWGCSETVVPECFNRGPRFLLQQSGALVLERHAREPARERGGGEPVDAPRSRFVGKARGADVRDAVALGIGPPYSRREREVAAQA